MTIIIRPITITEDMLLESTVSEPDLTLDGQAWSPTEICAVGDERYIASPSANFTVTIASPAVFTWNDNGLAVGTPFVPETDGALPSGITEGETLYVSQRITANTFTASRTINGRPITTTGSQSGTHTATAKVHQVYEAIQGQRGTVTFTNATERVNYADHGFTDGVTRVIFTVSGGAMPTGLSANTPYYVRNKTEDDFQLSTTATGAIVTFSTDGTGTITCGLYVNYNAHPALNPTIWAASRPTNRWAMFDNIVGTATTADDEIEVLIRAGRFDSLAVLGADADLVQARMEIERATVTLTLATPGVVNETAHGRAANTPVQIRSTGDLPTGLAEWTTYYVKDPLTNSYNLSATPGGAAIAFTGSQSGTHVIGEVIYERSMNLVDNSNVGDWEQYFFEEVYAEEAVALSEMVDAATMELPTFGEGVLILRASRSGGQVSIGTVKVGMSFSLGTTLERPEIGILDYSVKSTDDYGITTVVERGFSKRMNIEVVLDSDDVDSVSAVLSAYRAVPLVWIGGTYGSLIVYGFAKDWSITPERDGIPAILSAKVEGLT